MLQREDGTFLYLLIGESYFLFSMNEVQEVSQMLPLRSYPIHFSRHLGVVNLRGQVIPVFSIKKEKCCEKNQANCRLIIAKAGDVFFSFICSSVKKVVLSEEQLSEISSSGITQIDGSPASILRTSEIIDQGAA